MKNFITAGIICLTLTTYAHASSVYGVDDNNSLWRIDNPVSINHAATNVITSDQIGVKANSLAYDASSDNLFFVSSNMLGYYNPLANEIGSVGGLSLNLTANPNNASFYNGAYWYFDHDSNILNEAQITYVNDSPFVTAINTWAVLGMDADGINTNSFGDIAIDTDSGILYASTSRGRFYSVDLSEPVESFQEISASHGNDISEGLQLSFNSDNSTLYGHSYSTGDWYTVDTATGARTQIEGINTVGFRDLGGPATVPVPEPSSFALGAIGILGIFYLKRRLLNG